jgi:hypothetical protein
MTKEERREYDKLYYQRNKEKIKARSKLYKSQHKEHYREVDQKYRETHKEYYNELCKKWAKRNPEKRKAICKKYYETHKEQIIAHQRTFKTERDKARKAKDSLFKLRCNIRSLIAKTIREKGLKKSVKTEEILGCTLETFIEYMQSKFQEGMTLDNHRRMAHRPYNSCI